MEGFVTIGFILICFGHNVWAKDEAKYFILGKVLELRPPSGAATPITSVQWRHNGNIAAEWASDGGLDIYRNFKGRTVLNTTNGYLIVSKMTEEEAGTYSVEINNNRLDDQYVVRSTGDLSTLTPPPKIWPKSVEVDDERKLDCQGNVENAEPVTYWWNTAEGRSWVQLEKIIVVKNNETTRSMETFSCKIVNPVSEKESEPAPNPFYPQSGNSALGAIAIVPILLVLILAAVGYWKRDDIKRRFCSGKNEVRDGDGNGVVSVEEGVRLKEGAEPTPSPPKPAE